MKIAVLVKQVPDTYSEKRLRDDFRLDRDAADAVIDEIDSRGVEVALQLTEAHGGDVVVVTMGPDRALDAIRKALAMGASAGVHVVDDGLADADALTTSAVLAAALGTVGADLIIAGNESTDGRVGAMAGMIAERLDIAGVTQVTKLEVDGGTLTAERADEAGYSEVTAALPAIVSVTEKITEPRYPNFRGIMAAKKKPVTTVTVADLGVNLAPAAQVTGAVPRPPRASGEKITDDGTAGAKVAEFLAAERII